MTMSVPDRVRFVDEGVPPEDWHRVSKVTPLLSSWRAIVLILVLVVFQNLEILTEVLQSDTFASNPARLLLQLGGAALAVIALVLLYTYFAWRATAYAVTDQAVWLRKGIFFRSQRHVRFERIQAVNLVHPLLGRIFGLGRLTVEAAGGAGSNLAVEYLTTDRLTELRADILARAAGVKAPASPSPQDQATPYQPPVVEAPETPLYAVTTGTLVGSLLLSVSSLVLLIVVAAAIVGGVILWRLAGPAALSLLGVLVPVLIAVFVVAWGSFAGEFNFRAAVSPDGIRIRRGLVESRAETVPPRRLHGVRVSQPFFWRPLGWYRVTVTQAARIGGQESSSGATNVLLPVGNRRQALLALWLVLPDLGVADPTEFFDQVLRGRKRSANIVGVGRRAWFLDPLTYSRAGISLTGTAAVIRGGRFTRFGEFISYERIQSLVVKQGPLDRVVGVASVALAQVPGSFTMVMEHMASSDAAAVTAELVQRSHQSRESEPPEKWLQRVERELNVRPAQSEPISAEGAPGRGEAGHASTERGGTGHAAPDYVPVAADQTDHGQTDHERWKPSE